MIKASIDTKQTSCYKLFNNYDALSFHISSRPVCTWTFGDYDDDEADDGASLIELQVTSMFWICVLWLKMRSSYQIPDQPSLLICKWSKFIAWNCHRHHLMMMMMMLMVMMYKNNTKESTCCPSRCVSVQFSTLRPHGSFNAAKFYFFTKQISKPSYNPNNSLDCHFSQFVLYHILQFWVSVSILHNRRDVLNAKQKNNAMRVLCDVSSAETKHTGTALQCFLHF